MNNDNYCTYEWMVILVAKQNILKEQYLVGELQ